MITMKFYSVVIELVMISDIVVIKLVKKQIKSKLSGLVELSHLRQLAYIELYLSYKQMMTVL
jgi:hypothetical protein